MQEGFPSAREGRSGDVSHQNIYDSDDDIIEPHEDTSDNIEHLFDGDDRSMDINDDTSDKDDSHEGGSQSGSAEELHRFELKLKSSERSPKSEKDDDEDDKEDENPKPYNTHDYINNIEDHNTMMAKHNQIMAKHNCKLEKHMITDGAAPGSSGLFPISVNCNTSKAKATTKRRTTAIKTALTAKKITTATTESSKTTKKCQPNPLDPIHSKPQPHCFDDPNFHDPPGSPLKEEKMKIIDKK